MSLGFTSKSVNQLLPRLVQARQVNSCARNFAVQTGFVTTTYARRAETTQVREMATAAAGKKLEWLVIIPDHEGVIEKRLEVRAYVIPLSQAQHTSVSADKD